MKCIAKVCKCGRIFKWGKWYRFEELPINDKIEVLKAHNQSKVQQIIAPCHSCDFDVVVYRSGTFWRM